MLTTSQRALLDAAKGYLAYIDSQYHGMPPKGLYDDIQAGRELAGAVADVERDEQIADAISHGQIEDLPADYAERRR